MLQNIFDSHSHYDDAQFDADRDELLSNLPKKGVELAVSCGCDLETCEANRIISEKYDYIYFAAGFHPENLEGAQLSQIEKIKEYAAHEKCVAIGEIGLDYHWMSSSKEKQREFFTRQ